MALVSADFFFSPSESPGRLPDIYSFTVFHPPGDLSAILIYLCFLCLLLDYFVISRAFFIGFFFISIDASSDWATVKLLNLYSVV